MTLCILTLVILTRPYGIASTSRALAMSKRFDSALQQWRFLRPPLRASLGSRAISAPRGLKNKGPGPKKTRFSPGLDAPGLRPPGPPGAEGRFFEKNDMYRVPPPGGDVNRSPAKLKGSHPKSKVGLQVEKSSTRQCQDELLTPATPVGRFRH